MAEMVPPEISSQTDSVTVPGMSQGICETATTGGTPQVLQEFVFYYSEYSLFLDYLCLTLTLNFGKSENEKCISHLLSFVLILS